MAGERASVRQRTQLGPEVTPGTAVAATKRLGATTIQIQPAGNINRFAPIGEKFDTLTAIGKEWTGLRINGEGSYRDLAYLLAGLVRDTAPVQQGGTSAYLWTFTPRSSQEDIVQTYTVEQGEVAAGGRASRAAYGLIGALTLDWGRERVSTSGEGVAQREEDDVPLSTSATYTLTADSSPPTAGTFTLTHSGNVTAAINFDATPAQVQSALEALASIGAGNVEVEATVAEGAGDLSVADNVYTITFKRALSAQAVTLTGTFTGLTASGSIAIAAGTVGAAPTLIAPSPILGSQVDVYMDGAYDDIGTTKLLRTFKGQWMYNNRFGTLWPVNSSNPSFAAHVELKPEAMFSIDLMADDVGQGLLATMRTGDTKYFRWKATGGLIEGAYNFEAQCDMAAKISGVIEHKDSDGVYQNTVQFTLVDDTDLGYPFRWTVQNDLSAL